MKPVESVIEHNPPDSYGDCFRACIASILELPSFEVPHFALLAHEENGSDEDMVALCRKWVAPLGLGYIDIPLQSSSVDEMLRFCHRFAPGTHYVLTGQSKRGFGHCVIGYDDQIVFDPTYRDEPDGHGLIGGIHDQDLDVDFMWIGFLVRP